MKANPIHMQACMSYELNFIYIYLILEI